MQIKYFTLLVMMGLSHALLGAAIGSLGGSIGCANIASQNEECKQWYKIKECTASANGECVATVKEGDDSSSCKAANGASCAAIIKTDAPSEKRKTVWDAVKAAGKEYYACMKTNFYSMKCNVWSKNQTCTSFPGLSCKAEVSKGKLKDSCEASDGASCTASIKVDKPD